MAEGHASTIDAEVGPAGGREAGVGGRRRQVGLMCEGAGRRLETRHRRGKSDEVKNVGAVWGIICLSTAQT